ncbi:MAG TPA: Ldh family oxidoreductase [Pseudolabrys sp.]|nr:Ldh family oxidoreductase [Pseudolabrys sp.]
MTEAFSIEAGRLSGLVARLFSAAGVPDTAARTVAEALVEADLEGQSSHGVMLVELYLDRIRKGSVSLRQAGEIVSDKGATVVLDAHHALGHLTGDQAIDIAVERARRYGVGLVAVRHGFHFGTARRFALKAADADCIGIVMCNTRPLMPAPGGAERVVGNNPIAIAVPSDGPAPVVLDMATSEAAMGKIRMAAKSGQQIPVTWASKADGSNTTDPIEAIAGMLLPAGGPKGFGLAFLIDLLCGVLSGGATGAAVQPLYGDAATPYDSSHLFIAIDITYFGDRARLRAAVSAAAERIRAGARAPGVARLFTPGEPEWARRQSAAGQVTLPRAVAETLLHLANELRVPADALLPSEKYERT